MDDYATIALLVSSAFFVALSFGLLLRYRQVSQKITQSSDLGRDLWQALEQRLKKQDERILDMMARFEVIQSRSMAMTAAALSPPSTQPVMPMPPASPMEVDVPLRDVTVKPSVAQPSKSQPGSQLESQVKLDSTQQTALDSLVQKPLSTVQVFQVLKAAAGIESREHAARVMKYLFDRGLVSRDDSNKPFVYQLTENGRRYLSGTR
jgi:hypothetical protein